MASGLKILKNKVRTLKSTMKATKAMQLVSSAKFKHLRKDVNSSEEYYQNILNLMNIIYKNIEKSTINNTFEKNVLYGHQNNKILLIAISPNKGLCGSINANVYKIFNKFILSKKNDNKDVFVYSIGSKIKHFAEKRYPEICLNSASKDDLKNLHDILNKNEFSEIHIAYTYFAKLMQYNPIVEKIFPFNFSSTNDKQNEIIIEPDMENATSAILKLLFKSITRKAIIHSTTSENASRMIAMDNSTKSASKMIELLTKNINKIRQSNITRELIDIISGSQNLKN